MLVPSKSDPARVWVAERYGIRLLRIGMLFPMEPGIVRQFGRGLQELFVIEEKRAFVELFIRDLEKLGPVRREPAGPGGWVRPAFENTLLFTVFSRCSSRVWTP